MSFIFRHSKLNRAYHLNSKAKQDVYYSVDVHYFFNNMKYVVGSEWIAASEDGLKTTIEPYSDFTIEFHRKEVETTEIDRFLNVSLINNHLTKEDKKKIYQAFTERLSRPLGKYTKELASIYNNSIED